ncbi:MAG: ornithine carbamoyltransferase [Gammaproteobacteria bacterium]|nr:ornithine carbamoyltransferase [Gammaproteobacteria bacterium]MDD9895132.1 ornithine carbamoyltransferase [Gammaproteobacteria bacterium]MDD9958220.1 ornithine carbamoyltransferase [Gammaproteobacteria bacterium]
MGVKHFLTLLDLPSSDILAIIERSIALKKNPGLVKSQARKTLGMIFEKSSTRTRVAFETAMAQMDGASIFLTTGDSQLGRGEPIEDTARVLSRMVDCVAIRTFSHNNLERFAANSRVPVINALSDDYHPCQLLADVQTFMEVRGSISGKRVGWIGDGNNMCQSYINAARVFDFELLIATPAGFEPSADLVADNRSRVKLLRNPREAAKDVDLVVTDVWASMGSESEQAQRARAFSDYQVTAEIMALANSDALFMHCLPAHRGEEVSAEVLDAADSIVWEEAENRMHTQKALLEFLLD